MLMVVGKWCFILAISLGALADLMGSEVDVQQQPHISPPKNSVFRDIIWGNMNFIHTTDTHGWYAGHINQKQYSADWGDFISLTKNLRNKAESLGVDLLIVDTGDKHDGNGLSDASTPNGLFSAPIFNAMDYDLVTIGNHELYTEENSIQEYEVSVSHFGEKYVSSNVEFILENGTSVPFGNRYRYFETRNQKKRVLALSFLFDFKRFNARAKVTSIADTLKEESFNEILNSFPETSIDYLVVYGHIPVTDLQDEELLRLHVYLRRRYPNTVIQYFGGHSHIRDFAFYDQMATGLQSGRYCETLGWISINDTDSRVPVYNRRYIDFNREGFIHHSGVDADEFDSVEGLALSKEITKLRHELNLTEVYGYVPQSYLMNAYPYGHESNIYTLLNTTILPLIESEIERSEETNRAIIVNSGSIRYDLYKGEFTKDTEFIVSPFQNNWVYITVPKRLAVLVAPFLNRGDYILQELASPEKAYHTYKAEMLNQMRALTNQDLGHSSCHVVKKEQLHSGFTTHDDFGCDGDDVHHNTIPYYPSPNVIGSYQERAPDSEMADLVFYDFIESWILQALNTLSRDDHHSKSYSSNDVYFYGGLSTGKLLKQYFMK